MTICAAKLLSKCRNSYTQRRQYTPLGPTKVGTRDEYKCWSLTKERLCQAAADLSTHWQRTPLRSRTIFNHFEEGLHPIANEGGGIETPAVCNAIW